jgi:hypothetical protein
MVVQLAAPMATLMVELINVVLTAPRNIDADVEFDAD